MFNDNFYSPDDEMMELATMPPPAEVEAGRAAWAAKVAAMPEASRQFFCDICGAQAYGTPTYVRSLGWQLTWDSEFCGGGHD